MTAEILDFGRAWVVKWSDGSYTLEQSREDAELCVEYPSLCNPVAWEAMRRDVPRLDPTRRNP